MSLRSLSKSILPWVGMLSVIVGTLIVCYVVTILIVGTEMFRLDSECRVNGVFGTIEEALLQRRFWRAQVTFIDKEIAYWESKSLRVSNDALQVLENARIENLQELRHCRDLANKKS